MEPARLLDLTRLVSRLGRGPLTGIDRVELAYLDQFLALPPILFGLIRTAAGWLLLDRAGCDGLRPLIRGTAPLPPADLLSRLTNRTNPLRAQAETAARRLAIGRATGLLLPRLLRRLPIGCVYFNVGHTNLSNRNLAALSKAGLRLTVLIHDTIPLDHPAFARPDSVAPFHRKLQAVATHAHQVIHLTHAQRALTDAQMAQLGRIPPGRVAPLGVPTPRPDPAARPATVRPIAPYFVTLGTIEPRKNHALLLDVWDRLGPDAPTLYILGGRGWASADLLTRLDRLPAAGPVQVLSGLPDGAVAALLHGASALLAPSFAEGFGMPPIEAATLGTPVVASDLPVTRELLRDKAVYLDPADIYSWMETIRRLAQGTRRHDVGQGEWAHLTWEAHFKIVLNLG